MIIPTHDRLDYLAEAIDSVIRQTVEDWELIVVDDGSPTPASVPHDPRVRLIRVEENRGPAHARNVGAAAARGEYLCFCDDDDLFAVDRLAAIEPHLRCAPITICWSRFIDEVPTPGRRRLEGDVADVILDDMTPALGATSIRRDAFIPFDQRWHAVEDVDWWHRVTQHAEVTTVAHHGYLVRRHGSPRKRNDRSARAAENLQLLDANATWFARHRAARAFRLRRVGLLYASLGDRRAARRAFLGSLRARPSLRSARHLLRVLPPARQT